MWNRRAPLVVLTRGLAPSDDDGMLTSVASSLPVG
jgi:hypothetical protein